ncbi:alpha/beta hydrolase [Flavobacterium eburneipallidum]|uniref:alpha/beta hydrolase n=1 Tax=Flavobacterium eburneipallidum TaxID=3003263 RepID=UPI0022ABCE35|nr:alpha/beta hydrolase [Flavobacterium eburneipallidum]
MTKIPVYFMPGLAANASIFERIILSETHFEKVFLEWEIPLENETLSEYAKRISQKIHHPNPVLIGVSFGGILVQEMARFVDVRKVIIISSVKSNLEFPRRMKLAKAIKAYRMFPTNWVSNFENWIKTIFGSKADRQIQLYQKFLSVRDKRYLDWAMREVILWDRVVADENIIHIHGDADAVFPIKYISNCITVKGGTHIMILSKYKWLNENLPRIILE